MAACTFTAAGFPSGMPACDLQRTPTSKSEGAVSSPAHQPVKGRVSTGSTVATARDLDVSPRDETSQEAQEPPCEATMQDDRAGLQMLVSQLEQGMWYLQEELRRERQERHEADASCESLKTELFRS
ncbi:unnamed protein product [Symbiodinium sp. CCMP2592]|nr:unnamed protein product [Symbiodinium sp. CCMP2592]